MKLSFSFATAVFLLQLMSSIGFARVSPMIGVWEKTSEKCGSGRVLGGADGMRWEVNSSQVVHRWRGEFQQKIGSELKTLVCDVASGPIVIKMNEQSIAFLSQTVRHTISCPQLPLERTTVFIHRNVFYYHASSDQLITEAYDDYNVCPSFDKDGYGYLQTIFSYYKRVR